MARQMTRDVLPQACLPAVAASLLAYALVLQTAGERSEDADDWRGSLPRPLCCRTRQRPTSPMLQTTGDDESDHGRHVAWPGAGLFLRADFCQK